MALAKSNSAFTGWDTTSPHTCTANKTIKAQYADCGCTKGSNVDTCSVTGTTSNKCQYSYSCVDGWNNGGNTSGTFDGTAGTGTNTSPSCTGKNTYTITVAKISAKKSLNIKVHGIKRASKYPLARANTYIELIINKAFVLLIFCICCYFIPCNHYLSIDN